MIKSLLSRAALSAAVVAVLRLSAAAQSDASFASALGTLPSGFAVMARLKTVPQAPAQVKVQGPTAPAAVWKRVFEVVLAKGEVIRTEGSAVLSYSLEEKMVIRKDHHILTHSVDFLVLPIEDGKFRSGAALFTVSELLDKPATKQATRESWVFEVTAGGRLTSAKHYLSTYTETAGGEIERTNAPVEILALDAELTGEQFTAMLEYWSR